MKTLGRGLAFAVALSLSGCVAELVERKSPRKGPVPEVGIVDPGGGEVRYSVEGWGIAVGMRRFSAKRKMRRICKKQKIKLIDEFTREDVQVPYAGDDLVANMQKGLDHYAVAPYHHIIFECVPLDAPLSKPENKK